MRLEWRRQSPCGRARGCRLLQSSGTGARARPRAGFCGGTRGEGAPDTPCTRRGLALTRRAAFAVFLRGFSFASITARSRRARGGGRTSGSLGAARLPPGPSEAVARHSTRPGGGGGSGGRRPSRLPRGRPPPPLRGRLLIFGRPLPALPAAAAAAAAACSSDFPAAQAGAPARWRLLVPSARTPAATARGALPG